MARSVIIFFIMFLLQSVHTFAQEHGVKCRYLASHNITEDVLKMDDENIKKILIEKFSTDKKTYSLYFSRGKYLFTLEKEENVDNLNVIGVGGSVFIDVNADSIISQEAIIDKTFLIKDKIDKQNWQITGETRQIFKRNCVKAIYKSDIGDITAWFTTEIPFGFGPAGYLGLPGLITELVTPTYTYTLTEMSYLAEDMDLMPPTNGKVTNRAEFKKIKAEKGKQLGRDSNKKITIIEI